jgi:menaquinone-dependent protoporphyrinogen oxidase
VLVTYGSKRGGTAGIAEQLAAALAETGLEVQLAPAAEVQDVAPYDAVIVGGALYAYLWHRDAKRFVKRHADALQSRHVWFFSSGPLDTSARESVIPPVPGVRKLMERIGARGHVTFGGRLSADAKGFIARAMAKEHAGDWRDPSHIREWALEVARALGVPRLAEPAGREAPTSLESPPPA